MTLTAITPDDPRAAFIEGLRSLADVLEKHPEVRLPYDGYAHEITFQFLSGDDPRAEMAAAARAFPVSWDKEPVEYSDGTAYFYLKGMLHGLKVDLVAYRDAVCERVVTGTREITEIVKDPDALEAVPEIEVTRTEETVEWVCHSILSPAQNQEGPAAA